MSLVNDVLRDLERSKGHRLPSPRGNGIPLRAAPDSPTGRPPWSVIVLGTLGLISILAGGAAMWARGGVSATPEPAAVSAPPPAVLPVAVQPAPERAIPAPQPLSFTAPPPQLQVAHVDVKRSLQPPVPAPASPSPDRIARTSEVGKPERVFSEPRVERKQRPPSRARRAQTAYSEALAKLRDGFEAQADALLERALELNPDLRRAREHLAALWAKRGELTEAGVLLEEGLSRSPGYPPFAIALARIRVETSSVEKAIEVLESALPPIDAEPAAHAFLAALYQRSGDFERSARIYAQALERAPEHALWWVGMGISLESSGNDRSALAAYQMAHLRSRHRRLATAPREYLDARLRDLGRVDR